MAWTSPKTWSVGEVLTASDMNTYVRDNLNALKAPPSDNYEANEGANYTTSSATFADVDGTNLSLSITTTGGDIMIGFVGTLLHTAGNKIFFTVDIGGTDVAADDGIAGCTPANVVSDTSLSFVWLATSQAAGAKTIKLQWKTPAATATLYAGAGTSNGDVHPQFWCREVS